MTYAIVILGVVFFVALLLAGIGALPLALGGVFIMARLWRNRPPVSH